MKHIFSAALLLGLVGVSHSAIVYDNTTTSQNTYMPVSYNAYSEGGDDVSFAGTNRAIDWAEIGMFNGGVLPSTGSLTLNLYNLDGGFQGPNPLPGTLIASSTVTNLTFNPGDAGLVQFNFANVVVPNSIGWSIVVGGGFSQQYVGVNFFGPPTTGTTVFGFFERDAVLGTWGRYVVPLNEGGFAGDLEARFDAVPAPEPSSLCLLAIGFTYLCGRRKQRRSP